MRAKLSVVIPTLNAASALTRSLPPLIEGLSTGLIRELVISDGGSTDETLIVAEETGAVIVKGPASRGFQLQRGAQAAKGEWLLFLHADTVLPDGWAQTVEAHFPAGSPAYFNLSFDAVGLAPRFVAAWANIRSRYLHLPYGDQGLLITRAELEQVGGYPDIPLMEDVALVRRFRHRLKALPDTVLTSADKYERDGWIRRGSRNLSILIRYFLGATPEKLARRYYG